MEYILTAVQIYVNGIHLSYVNLYECVIFSLHLCQWDIFKQPNLCERMDKFNVTFAPNLFLFEENTFVKIYRSFFKQLESMSKTLFDKGQTVKNTV